MRRSNFLLLALLVTASGCAPRPEAVFVRLDGIDSPTPPVRSEKAPDSPPATGRATAVTLAARPERTLVSDSAERAQRAQRAIAEDRRRALRLFERQFLAEAIAEIEVARDDRLREVEAQRTEFRLAAQRRLREVFEAYAEQRWPVATRLETVVARPVRNPATEVARKDVEERRSLIEDLRLVDARYVARRQQITQEAVAEFESLLAKVESEMALRRAEATVEAAEQARQELGRAGAPQLPTLGRRVISAPALPPLAVAIPAPSAPTAVPPVPGVRPLASAADRRALLEERARIWAATRGYVLVSDPRRGRDATQEFKTWMGNLQAGR